MFQISEESEKTFSSGDLLIADETGKTGGAFGTDVAEDGLVIGGWDTEDSEPVFVGKI
jgi:hypothetical protein